MAVGTLGIIALGLVAGGTALSATGQVKAGNAAERAGAAAADREIYNSRVAELLSADALARGFDEESRFRTQVRTLIGSQRAAFAGQNVDVGSGSAADVQADAAYLGELDAQTIRLNAAREAWGYQVEAEDRRMAADVARKGGQAAASAGRWGAAATGLSGAGSLLLTAYGWQREGGRR